MAKNIQSLEKAMLILDALEKAKRPLSLLELSQYTGFPKSTLHGLISTLRDGSYIDQSPYDGKYCLGIRLFELGCSVSQAWDIVSLSEKYMQSIAFRTGETVNLSKLDRGEVLLINHISKGGMLYVSSGSGARFPMHCTAQGKVLLAYMTAQELDMVLRRYPLTEYTPHTITDREVFEKELKLVRESGYAIENGELRIGLRSVAAPVFDHMSKAAYSLSVTGMYRRITDSDFELAKKLVTEAAEKISAEMGKR